MSMQLTSIAMYDHGHLCRQQRIEDAVVVVPCADEGATSTNVNDVIRCQKMPCAHQTLASHGCSPRSVSAMVTGMSLDDAQSKGREMWWSSTLAKLMHLCHASPAQATTTTARPLLALHRQETSKHALAARTGEAIPS